MLDDDGAAPARCWMGAKSAIAHRPGQIVVLAHAHRRSAIVMRRTWALPVSSAISMPGWLMRAP
jgi:hypothetical protein